VRSVVRNRTGVKGAVYVNAPTQLADFSTTLASDVAFQPAALDVEGGVARRISATTKEERSPSPSEEPLATWLPLHKALAAAAVKFKEKHKRPAVLIIDSAEIIAKDNPAFFAKLQDFAKQMTDAGNLRLVFVSSDGTVLEQMQSRSAWSRAHKEVYEVGDIPDADAVKYLVGRQVPHGQAEEAVRTITGGRFELLTDYVKVYAAVGNAATRDKLHAKVDETLRRSIKLSSDHVLFRTLLTRRVVDSATADALVQEATLKALLAANILAAHPDPTKAYTFHSRYVESYFQAVFSRAEQ
jgi:hypothetical protein